MDGMTCRQGAGEGIRCAESIDRLTNYGLCFASITTHGNERKSCSFAMIQKLSTFTENLSFPIPQSNYLSFPPSSHSTQPSSSISNRAPHSHHRTPFPQELGRHHTRTRKPLSILARKMYKSTTIQRFKTSVDKSQALPLAFYFPLVSEDTKIRSVFVYKLRSLIPVLP